MPDFSEEQICSELSHAVNDANSRESTPNGIDAFSDRYRARILPEVHTKSKALPNGNSSSAMDESILIQPEQQQMEIFNGNRCESSQLGSATVPNGNGIAAMPMQRRRRNSFNSKPPIGGDIITYPYARSDSISPNTNSKFTLQNGSRALSVTQPPLIRPNHTPSQTTTNISISCPDGLAHALSEQNLRLQQLVLDHKVN